MVPDLNYALSSSQLLLENCRAVCRCDHTLSHVSYLHCPSRCGNPLLMCSSFSRPGAIKSSATLSCLHRDDSLSVRGSNEKKGRRDDLPARISRVLRSIQMAFLCFTVEISPCCIRGSSASPYPLGRDHVFHSFCIIHCAYCPRTRCNSSNILSAESHISLPGQSPVATE